MMARTRKIGPAVTFLIRAFSPGCPTMLRSWESRPEGRRGERLTIFFDLPSPSAIARAKELAASAGNLRLIRVGRTVLREVTAEASARHGTLRVDVLLVREAPSAAWGRA